MGWCLMSRDPPRRKREVQRRARRLQEHNPRLGYGRAMYIAGWLVKVACRDRSGRAGGDEGARFDRAVNQAIDLLLEHRSLKGDEALAIALGNDPAMSKPEAWSLPMEAI
jgi:hypothetical protein